MAAWRRCRAPGLLSRAAVGWHALPATRAPLVVRVKPAQPRRVRWMGRQAEPAPVAQHSQAALGAKVPWQPTVRERPKKLRSPPARPVPCHAASSTRRRLRQPWQRVPPPLPSTTAKPLAGEWPGLGPTRAPPANEGLAPPRGRAPLRRVAVHQECKTWVQAPERKRGSLTPTRRLSIIKVKGPARPSGVTPWAN